MGMNESKGNMYEFVTHTWNTIKGACPHDCSYCYMKRWGDLNPVHFDHRELKTDLGEGNFIFVGSSCDMWAEFVEPKWVEMTLEKCRGADNQYLFQTKDPVGLWFFERLLPPRSVLCTTIETNRVYPEVMRRSPSPTSRALFMKMLDRFPHYVTIEPIMDFDLGPMVELIRCCEPDQVNIGADSGGNGLPEPSRDKVLALIEELQRFTTIARKTNLGRILDHGN